MVRWGTRHRAWERAATPHWSARTLDFVSNRLSSTGPAATIPPSRPKLRKPLILQLSRRTTQRCVKPDPWVHHRRNINNIGGRRASAAAAAAAVGGSTPGCVREAKERREQAEERFHLRTREGLQRSHRGGGGETGDGEKTWGLRLRTRTKARILTGRTKENEEEEKEEEGGKVTRLTLGTP